MPRVYRRRTGQEQNTWDGKAGTTTSGANFGGIGSQRSGAQDPGSFAAAPGPPRDPVAGRPPRSRHCGVRCLHSRRLAARFRFFFPVSAGGSRGGFEGPVFSRGIPPASRPPPRPADALGWEPAAQCCRLQVTAWGLGAPVPWSFGHAFWTNAPGGAEKGELPGAAGRSSPNPRVRPGPPSHARGSVLRWKWICLTHYSLHAVGLLDPESLPPPCAPIPRLDGRGAGLEGVQRSRPAVRRPRALRRPGVAAEPASSARRRRVPPERKCLAGVKTPRPPGRTGGPAGAARAGRGAGPPSCSRKAARGGAATLGAELRA